MLILQQGHIFETLQPLVVDSRLVIFFCELQNFGNTDLAEIKHANEVKFEFATKQHKINI